FVSSGLEWGVQAAREIDDEPERKKKRPERVKPAVVEPAPQPVQVEPQPRAAEPRTEPAPRTQVPIDAELAALEAQFVALDAPGDAPERLALLDRLGRVYGRLGRRRDAGLCFARAVWEASPQDAPARIDGWLTADLGRADPKRTLDAALALTAPGGDAV